MGDASSEGTAGRERYAAIDVLRGIVMALMAIDHVRVYSGVPAGGPTPGVFFTRWVTHFCAPVFVFLAGTSAFLQSRGKPAAELSRSLLVRGLFLILLEFTYLRFAWTFNFDYRNMVLLGVIWMLGACMVLMSGLSRLPTLVLAIFGFVIVFGHNAIGPALGKSVGPLLESDWGPLLKVLYFGGGFAPMNELVSVAVLYSLIPWIGVMALGFVFGSIVELQPAKRRAMMFRIGFASIALFFVVRGLDGYGDPRPWHGAQVPAPIAFINTTKYPASLDFLLMTLGPAIVLLPLLEGASNRLSHWFETFGRAPMFFYLLHIPLIHLMATGIAFIRTPQDIGWLFGNHPIAPPPRPEGYMWSLGLLYLVTFVALVVLYQACGWYVREKRTRRHAWQRYI